MGSLRAAALLGIGIVLAISRAAHADASADLAEIRSGKLPVRHEMLGWAKDGSAIFRALVCAESGTVFCTAYFTTARASAAPTVTSLLDVAGVFCQKGAACDAIRGPVATRFVAAETRALAALPERVAAVPAADPAALFGTVVGVPVSLDFRTLAITLPDLGDGVRTDVVLRGPRGAVEHLADLGAFVQRMESHRIVAAYPSPDGARVALAVEYATGMMCWGPTSSMLFAVVDVAKRRASLANTVGFRAWKAGEMAAAHVAFVEATALDPSFALAWFNRAAVESRAGDLAVAHTSLDRAAQLDPSMIARACKDPDFDPLKRDPALPLRCGAK